MIVEMVPLNGYSGSTYDDEILDLIKNLGIGFRGNSTDYRKAFEEQLHHLGWAAKYRVIVSSNVTITSVRGSIALCLQLGNIARIFYDVLKLQYLYRSGHIDRAIIICPIQPIENRAYLNRFVKEVGCYNEIITVPLLAVGIEEGDE